MHPPPPDVDKLIAAFQDSNPAYIKLIPHETCLRAQRPHTPWKQMETLFSQECGVKASYSTLRRFLADTDRLRATWATGNHEDADLSPAPPSEALHADRERQSFQTRIAALEAELSALRSETFGKEEEIAAQTQEIAGLLQRNLALEAERESLAARVPGFEDWPPDPAAPRRGFALGLLAGLILAALAAWLWWSETPLRGLAAFAEASAYGFRRGPGWSYSLHRHRSFLYIEGAVIAAGLLCGLGPLRLCALAALVWLTYAALIHALYPAFWILLLLTVRVSGSLLYLRRDFP